MSLAQLNRWCDTRFGAHLPKSDATERPYDIPWMIMDNSLARRDFGWTPAISLDQVLEGIAAHAEKQPDWLERSGL
jgi:CDP-paratose 2-epimerase